MPWLRSHVRCQVEAGDGGYPGSRVATNASTFGRKILVSVASTKSRSRGSPPRSFALMLSNSVCRVPNKRSNPAVCELKLP